MKIEQFKRRFIAPALAWTAILLIAAGAAKAAPATTIPSSTNWVNHPTYQSYYNNYIATMKGKPVDLIFVGDSITEQFRNGTGNSVWKAHGYETRAIDFGQSSDTTQNALWRLGNLSLAGFSPKVAFILIGTNNFNDTPADIAAGVKAVINATLLKFPGIKVVVQSILPNARATAKMAAANVLIANFGNGSNILFLDLAAKFPPDGKGNWVGLNSGKLHLTTGGYETWADTVDALLPKVLPSQLYEAEDQTLSPGSVLETLHAGYTGRGYVNTNNVSSSYVEWKISVPSAGNHTLDFRFSNGTTGARPATLSVNGVPVSPALDFGTTADWATWSDVVVTRSLNAGSNTIRVTATSATGCPNLDSLTVSQ